MVPDADAPDDAPDRHETAGRPDGDTYDLVYHATRDALWDVLGTATLILFYVAVAGIGLSIAVGAVGPFVRGSGSVTALAVGVVALVAGVFAAVRVYRLVTE